MEQTEPTTQERILKALADQKATISDLRDKLKTSEKERDNATTQISSNEFYLEAVIEAHEQMLKKANDAASAREFELKQDYGATIQAYNNRWTEKCEELLRTKIHRDKARAAEANAKAEAKEAKEQVENIWEVLQGDEGALQGKRKADDVADGRMKKKVRMESEA